MFGKILKYDLRAILKYWWIAAVSSFVFAVFAGICINILKVEYTEYYFLFGFAILGLVLSIIGIAIFSVVNEILILVRLYKHFFTDEGYLTFTLPVKKNQLLNSKILMAFIFQFITTLIIVFDIFVILAIGIPKELFDPSVYEFFYECFDWLFNNIGIGFVSAYLIEIILICVVASLLQTLIVFVCLTVASLISRKHKVITAIALFYAANSVLSGVVQFVSFNSSFITVFDKLIGFDFLMIRLFVLLILFLILAVTAMLVCGVYLLENWLLDKKLNLE